MDASEIYLRRNQGERSIDATKKWIFVFSQQQMVQLNCQEETTNSENPLLRQEQPVGVWRSQCRNSRRTGRVSTDRNKRWRWSPERLLVDPRWLHLSSSQWTSSSTLCAEWRSIPYEIHWCHQGYLRKSGCVARKTKRWLLECARESKFIRFLDRIHEAHIIEWETSNMIYVVWRDTDNKSSNYRPENVACSMDPNWKSRSKERKTRVGNRAAKTENIKKPSKMWGESWKFQWRS